MLWFEAVSVPPLPELIAGRYRPVRLLGKGGMGAVYEVEHIHTGQRLAMKVLTAQPGASVERFKREARAASRIVSDHIVRVTDADTAPELDGASFLIMELLDGADLERVTANRPTPPEDVVGWLRQVSRALGKAHEAGIVHRDLKPENLFLTKREDGTPLVKILDFGIAKMSSEGTVLTASDAFLGTPGYMAPEQTDSRGPPVTSRADLYALGLIAFKLLTGRMYWVPGSLGQLLAQILAEPMPPASERGATLGPAFDAWFARACDRNADRRFASAHEQTEALAAALGLPSESPAQTTEAAPAPAAEGLPGAGSLNGSFTDLSGSRKKLVQRRIVGAVVAIAVATVAIGMVVLQRAGGGPGPSAQSSAAPANLVTHSVAADVSLSAHSVAAVAPPAPSEPPMPPSEGTPLPAVAAAHVAPTAPKSNPNKPPSMRTAPPASATATVSGTFTSTDTFTGGRAVTEPPATSSAPAPSASAPSADPLRKLRTL